MFLKAIPFEIIPFQNSPPSHFEMYFFLTRSLYLLCMQYLKLSGKSMSLVCGTVLPTIDLISFYLRQYNFILPCYFLLTYFSMITIFPTYCFALVLLLCEAGMFLADSMKKDICLITAILMLE